MAEEAKKNPVKKVDIRQVFMDKSPKMARILPGFVYAYIKRIIHQDYINDFLERHGDKQGIDFVNAAIEDFNVNIITHGEENIPSKGRYIFVSNHPLGGFDGLVLLSLVSKHFNECKFLVNDILLNLSNVKELFVPINTLGGQSRENAKKIDALFRSDAQVLTFPAGLVSRKIKGKIQDPPWKKNFIQKAIQYKRNVIPVHFTGRNTNFFYNLARLRKFLRIKYNLEMFYLPDQTYKHRNKTLHVTFGKPVSWKQFDKSRTHQEWADTIREMVYALPDKGQGSQANEK